MNITDASGFWKVTSNMITNRKTGESRFVSNIPSSNAIAYMTEDLFIRK